MNYTGGFRPYNQGSSSSLPPQSYQATPQNPSPYPSNPSSYPPNPTSYPQNPSPYPSNPSPYPPNPTSYPPNPSSYPSNPSSYPPNPSSYPSNPSPYPPNPSLYPPNPSSYPSNPNSYPPNPSSYPTSYPPTSLSYPSNPTYGLNPNPTPSNPALYPSAPSQYPVNTQSQHQYPSSIPGLSSSQPLPYPINPLPSSLNTSTYSSPYPSNPPKPTVPTSHSAHSLYPSAQLSSNPSTQPACNQSFYPKSSPYPQQTFSAASYAKNSQSMYNKGTPTVKPAHPFDPKADAEILYKAMKGFGTDEKAIIGVFVNRSNAQRVQIEHHYKTMYGKDLKENLKSELSGNFEKLILALLTPMLEFQAQELHWACSGLGTSEKTLIEFLCSANNSEIHAVGHTYERLFKRTLERDIEGDTSGYFKRLLVSLCQGRRNENYAVDEAAAAQDAQALMEAGELRLGTDETVFNKILCNRSYPQLARVFHEYKMFSGREIEESIESEFSGDIKTGLLAIVKCVRDKSGFFAEQLYKSMKGLGTDDKTLIRLVTLRCEIDMEDIKRAFSANYGKSLESFIQGDTSGDYRRCLLALIESHC